MLKIASLMLPIALVAVSCSGSSTDSDAASTSSTTDVGADATSTSTSTSTPTPDPSTSAGPTTEPAITTTTPADAIGFASAFADFDDDGSPDQLVTYFSPADDRFRIRFLPGVGGSFDVLITDSSSIGAVRSLGGCDVEGDGDLEAFVVVGSGASATLIGLYDVSACTISRVTLDGNAAAFPVGASIGNISGLACDGAGHIDELFASNSGGDSYDGGFIGYTLVGNVLQQGFGDGAIFESFEEAANSAGGFDCPPLTL